MTIGLLVPLALGLLALVLGPVFAHMALQQPSQKLAYGATLLLERLMKRLRRRRRIRDLPLLILRALLVAAVALAATRPELRRPGAIPPLGGTGSVIVVLDNSLSMDLRQGDGTLLSRAREDAVALVRGLPDGVLLGAVTTGGDAKRLTPALNADHERVAELLQEVASSEGTTDLAGGLRLARQLLGGEPGEVVVYTDEAGPDTIPSAREELSLLASQGAAIIPRPIRADNPVNTAVQEARYGDGPEGGSVRLRVMNYGSEAREVPCTVKLPDGASITAFVSLPAGDAAEELVTVPRVAEGGVALATCEDGQLAADDTYAFQLPRIGASRVLVVDGDPGATPVASEVYFLERALAPWGGAGVTRGGLLPDVTSTAGVADLDPTVHRVVFLANVADPGPLAVRLVDFVRKGGGLVLGMGDNVTAERYNGALSSLLPAALRRPRALAGAGEDGVATSLPDPDLELFVPFSRGGRLGFGNVRWRTLMTLEPYQDGDEVSTLLTAEGGLPLLVERRVGAGRVLLLTGTFDLGWGNLPLQAVYMPLVQRVVSYLGGEAGGGGERMEARVGTTVSVALPDSGLDVSVTGPAGPVASSVRSGTLSFVPEHAGAYLVEAPGAPPLAYVAVNTDPRESDVRHGPTLMEVASSIDPERFVLKTGLAPWLLGLALALALVQAALAGRLRATGEE